MSSPVRCLVTGASGYIGGRLVPELLSAGYAVRCMARDPGKLSDRPWSDDIEIAVADVMDSSAVRRALQGVDVAYYLIHSLGTGASFERRDRAAAEIFAAAAKAAGVQRIVYLGGIISGQAGKLSPHLRSRAEVGDILLASGVPTVALQAAVIIGSGSASFEMLRYLTERLPAMVTPQWVDTRIQPIAVRDVLYYLVVGLRRGRRDPRHLLAGDALDFWRVEAIEPGKLLRLRAEMKLPGLAWLELSVGQDYDGLTTYSQRAIFRPRGLAGHAYWRSISPFHGVVFGGMLKNITAAAERAERAGDTPLPG